MDIFFELLQASIGTRRSLSRRPTADEWHRLMDTSVQHGLTALTFGYVRNLPKADAPDADVAVRWFAAATNAERVMGRMRAVATDFAGRLWQRRVAAVMLKGQAFAQYYANPLHREFGDIDCFLRGPREAADSAMAEMGCPLCPGAYKHTRLSYRGIPVENHIFFTSFGNTRRGLRTERHLATLFAGPCTPIGDTDMLAPSADFTALFMPRHAQSHFTEEGIRMRYVLDWAMFLRAEQDRVDWPRVLSMMDDAHLSRFVGVLTALAVRCLGISVSHDGLRALALSADSRLTDLVLADTMGPQPAVSTPGLWHKTRRIARRFVRMWRFRSLACEPYARMVWNAFAFSSYLHRSLPPIHSDLASTPAR